MKSKKVYLYGFLLALPFMGFLFYLLNPPQCPLSYTQEQVNASRCIVGANIGGLPIFIVLALATWLTAVWLINALAKKRRS